MDFLELLNTCLVQYVALDHILKEVLIFLNLNKINFGLDLLGVGYDIILRDFCTRYLTRMRM